MSKFRHKESFSPQTIWAPPLSHTLISKYATHRTTASCVLEGSSTVTAVNDIGEDIGELAMLSSMAASKSVGTTKTRTRSQAVASIADPTERTDSQQ